MKVSTDKTFGCIRRVKDQFSTLILNKCKFRQIFCYFYLTIFLILILIIVQRYPSFNHRSWRQDDSMVNPRICCLILTAPNNFMKRAIAINQTWAPRCDRYYFISEFNKSILSKVELLVGDQLPIAPIKNIPTGYSHLTRKSALAFVFAYEHHVDDFDWFLKADDDTYLIVENLRAFLREKNSSEPVTFGYNFRVS